ncbi:MAG: acyl dehydratase, partial [SAR324 cluster bacterium]|nr:acyl dehydratase [SAR324 cluster bacterium]
LVIKNPVFVGDTLHTTTKVVGLKQNKVKPGRAPTGMVALEMLVRNQHGQEVMKFWRCPMIPCRNADTNTGYDDSFDSIPAELNMEEVKSVIPENWNLAHYRQTIPGTHFNELETDTVYVIHSRDTITSAPELVRLTLNMATTHTDATTSAYGKRLVYGGHTITMAGAQTVRAIKNLMTFVAWRKCDHTAPVFEQDILRTEVSVIQKYALSQGGLVDFHVDVFAERGDQSPEPGKDIKVLDWDVIGLMA